MPEILLLHGALGSDRQLEPLKVILSKYFNVHTLCFEGHGSRTTDEPLRIELFSKNLLNYLKESGSEKPLVFGYSMGGYVALYTEAQNPGTFGKIVTLGSKFHWSPESSRREVKMLQPEVIEEKVPKFATHLNRMHEPNAWKENMRATAEMMISMGQNPPLNHVDLSLVECSVILTLGGKDAMVSQEETITVKNQLSNASFHLFEEFEHPFDKIDLGVLAAFLNKELEG